jgi:hypothetical protein
MGRSDRSAVSACGKERSGAVRKSHVKRASTKYRKRGQEHRRGGDAAAMIEIEMYRWLEYF